MQKFLHPLSFLYGAATFFRNRAFDAGFLRVAHVSVPVISVGNLTAGGTGKTPLVEWLVRRLIAQNRRVAVVSRGYGRTSRGVVVVSDGKSVRVDAALGGDEPVMIARKFPGVAVVVGERRREAAEVAVRELGAGVIVLDDGFQHRYIHRDTNVLLLDASVDIRREPLLPAGMRREPLGGLGRADLVVWSGVAAQEDRPRLESGIRRWYTGPTAGVRYELVSYTSCADGRRVGIDEFRERRVFAFCAIGRPERFLASLRERGLLAEDSLTFRDHHWYRPADIEEILTRFAASGAELMLTTEKDAVRMETNQEIAENFLRPFPVWYAALEMVPVWGEGELTAAIDRST
jgi:tetraacyldisaccharide 4'-kinase